NVRHHSLSRFLQISDSSGFVAVSATRTSSLLRVNAACSVPTARWVVGSVVRPSPPQIESFQADS
ncbi:MAG: hypothetical protein O2900_16550, partial [Proteobacteria bacterium]|nr:hypothetical protein [Pseudomonadota bacterium]